MGLKNCPKDGLGLGATTFGFGYSLAKQVFCGVRVNNLTCGVSRNYSGQLTYVVPNMNDVTLAAKYSTGGKDASNYGIGAVYKCNPNTILKFKAWSCGTLNVSCKQSVTKGFEVVGAVSRAGKDSSVSYGIAATLG